MTAYKVTHIVAMALAVALLILPFGVHHVTVTPSETTGVLHENIETCSYFDMLPVTDGNMFPMFTAICTFVVLVMAALTFVLSKQRWLPVALIAVSALGVLGTMAPLLVYGADGFSPVALTIAFLMLCSLVISVHYLTGDLFCEQDDDEEE